MKAFMSTWHRRGEWWPDNQNKALQEAQAILAVSEPRGQGYNYNVWMYREILAEALEGFVEEGS